MMSIVKTRVGFILFAWLAGLLMVAAIGLDCHQHGHHHSHIHSHVHHHWVVPCSAPVGDPCAHGLDSSQENHWHCLTCQLQAHPSATFVPSVPFQFVAVPLHKTAPIARLLPRPERPEPGLLLLALPPPITRTCVLQV